MTTSTEDPRRRRRGLVVIAAAVVGVVLLAGVAVVARPAAHEPAAAVGRGPFRGSEPPGRFLLPDFELRSYRGGPVTTADLRGRVVLLTVLDSQCAEACPIIASVVARTMDRLEPDERAEVRAIAVTGDPAEDTPAAIRVFLRPQRAEGRLDYLIGTEKQLRPVWGALRVLPSLDSGRDTLHSAPLRIYSRDGVWLATLHSGADLSEANVLHDIRVALEVMG